jgi:hypothetical protein
VADLNSREFIAFAHALAGEKVSLDDLSNALTKMLGNLTPHVGGNRRKARAVILQSTPAKPAYLRGVFAALLTLPSLDDVQLLTIWEIWHRQNPAGSAEDFGRWWADSPLREGMRKDAKKKGGKIARLNEPRSAAKRLKRVLEKQNGPE